MAYAQPSRAFDPPSRKLPLSPRLQWTRWRTGSSGLHAIPKFPPRIILAAHVPLARQIEAEIARGIAVANVLDHIADKFHVVR